MRTEKSKNVAKRGKKFSRSNVMNEISFEQIIWKSWQKFRLKHLSVRAGIKRDTTLQRLSRMPHTVSLTALDEGANSSRRSQLSPVISCTFDRFLLASILRNHMLANFSAKNSSRVGTWFFALQYLSVYLELPLSHLTALMPPNNRLSFFP